ncbi:MAG: 16S rRNA (uracil(1498)-N(3))-methyltransferase [Gammaproteobacteria bacterium]|nr:16S rRNA (uracil(1498)-N(3))-methyltransferase [Gammaproteobacteria bacterium]
MRIPRCYCPELKTTQTHYQLPDSAHRHAVQVLRLKAGSVLHLFNGAGYECEATLEFVSKRESNVVINQIIERDNESPLKISLLQGISRGERMDYALQKAVELGVTNIIPVITERCNVQLSNGRADKRLQHWQGVMISACEQSGRTILPELADVTEFKDVIEQVQVPCRLVLDPVAETGFSSLAKQDNVALLIGPEGGLTDAEIAHAKQARFQAVKFGPRILRTETASAAALAIVQAMWGDLG